MAAPHPDELPGIEAQALGAAILDPEACAHFVASIPPERLTVPAHRRLADHLWRLFSEGAPVNSDTLTASGVKGSAIATCVTAVRNTGNVPFLATLIAEAHIARQMRQRLARAVKQSASAEEGDGDVFDLLDTLQRDLSEIALSGAGGGKADTHIRSAVEQALIETERWREGETTEFAPSGFYSIDRTTGGLPIGELTTLAAMTGAGKTSILVQSARAVALAELSAVDAGRRKAPRPIVLFSAEMSAKQIVLRMASGAAKQNTRTLRAGAGMEEDYAAFDLALANLARLPIHIDDDPAPTFSRIAARLTQAEATGPGGIAYVGVDYDEKVATQGQTEELRVSAIAQGLKVTAKRFNVPVLALSQYSRAATHTEYPSNKWLRYSGKKEHESAQIIHWHYPQYWVDEGHDAPSVRGLFEDDPALGSFIVTKNRFGPKGKLPMRFYPATTSFVDPMEPTEHGLVPSNRTPF